MFHVYTIMETITIQEVKNLLEEALAPLLILIDEIKSSIAAVNSKYDKIL